MTAREVKPGQTVRLPRGGRTVKVEHVREMLGYVILDGRNAAGGRATHWLLPELEVAAV